MTAYVIFLREGPVEDTAEYEQYLTKMPDPSHFALTPLALYGAIEPLEKAPADGIVLLSFPTVEAAREWYYSEGYQAAAAHRIKAANYRAMIVEGL